MPEPQETQVQFLGQDGPLEEEMAIHSSILPWGEKKKNMYGGAWRQQSLESQSQTWLSD